MSRRVCPNEPNENCKYYDLPPCVPGAESGCYGDRHHQAFPRTAYKTKLEKQFRVASAIFICRAEHDVLHTFPAPEKPTMDVMRQYLGQLASEGLENGTE